VNLISEGTSILVAEHAPKKWEVLILVYATCIVLFRLDLSAYILLIQFVMAEP
jgi:hypothetical protein